VRGGEGAFVRERRGWGLPLFMDDQGFVAVRVNASHAVMDVYASNKALPVATEVLAAGGGGSGGIGAAGAAGGGFFGHGLRRRLAGEEAAGVGARRRGPGGALRPPYRRGSGPGGPLL
jgi:hypothetical protein